MDPIFHEWQGNRFDGKAKWGDAGALSTRNHPASLPFVMMFFAFHEVERAHPVSGNKKGI